jgi:hypothetical protein
MFDSVSIYSAPQFGHIDEFSVRFNFRDARPAATIALRESLA